MKKDPVCQMKVKEVEDAVTIEHNGEVYYFCTEGCQQRFLKNPELFLSKTKKATNLYCIVCNNEILDKFYISGRLYCCEKCYFKDQFLGDVLEKLEGINLAIIEAFVDAIDAREHEVGNHSFRVTQFAMVLSLAMGITGRTLLDIYCGSLLHDIGKIGIPDSILLKQGKLSENGYETMKKHPEIGYTIIRHIDYFSKAAEIIYSHHEHYDGSGYPRGLKRNEIPLGARIFTICDTLDALTVDRVYRKAISFDSAKEYILSESGSLFDPSVVECFPNAEKKFKEFIAKIML